MVAKDEWVRAAMTDDKMVVELLVRLKQAQAASPVKQLPPQVIPLRWGLRLPRSRPSPAAARSASASASASASIRCGGDDDDVSGRLKEGDSSTRCSPTTPLSWSGGGGCGAASPSATGDGAEETSSHRADGGSPTGGTLATETASNSAKRSRKKKKFAELKEEEGLLLEERMHLTKEIATLHATLEEHITTNESLKRMKLGLNVHIAKGSGLTSCKPEKLISSKLQLQQTGVSSVNRDSSIYSTQTRADNHLQSDSSELHKAVSNRDRIFLLPDLNMMPSEEDHGSGGGLR